MQDSTTCRLGFASAQKATQNSLKNAESTRWFLQPKYRRRFAMNE